MHNIKYLQVNAYTFLAITCGKLSTGIIGADCANPLIPGVKPTAILINRDDIDIDLTDVSNGVITNLALKAGKKAYLAETLENGIDANIAFAKGTYYNGWDHNFVFRIFDNTPTVKSFIDDLSKSRIAVIIENNYIKYNPDTKKGEEKGDTVYEIYGFYTGLELKEATRDTKDADTKGGWVLTCGCNDTAKEPTLPLTVFKDSLLDTLTLLETLTGNGQP